MKNCNHVATPADPGLKLTKGTEESEYVEEKHYQSMVHSLLNLSMRTQPDIAFAVSHAACFCSKSTTTSDSSETCSEIFKRVHTLCDSYEMVSNPDAVSLKLYCTSRTGYFS